MTSLEKIKYLDRYLLLEKKTDLATVLGLSKNKVKAMLSGEKKLSKRFIKKVAIFFSLNPNDITSENEDLPTYKEIVVNDELIKIQKDEWEVEINKNKHKNVIGKCMLLLSHSKKIKLWLTSILIILPLLGYASYCTYDIYKDNKANAIKFAKTPEEDLPVEQVGYQNDLYKTSRNNPENASKVVTPNSTAVDDIINNASLSLNDKKDKLSDLVYYVPVTIGMAINTVKSISPSNDSFVCKFDVWFDFDQDLFVSMMKAYFCNYPTEDDGQIDFDNISTLSKYFPFTYSTINSSHQFTMVEGKIDSVETPVPAVFYINDEGNNRVYQKLRVISTISHDFTSIRYPLESLELSVGIESSMDADYIRFEPDNGTVASSDGNSYKKSGYMSDFSVGNGYRVISNADTAFGMTQTYNKFVTNNPNVNFGHTLHSQVNSVMRFNREGMGLFLQAFVNLFAVTIWIMIAFFDASFNKEDVIGMLGTGLFGAISSIIVGINLLADSATFSLVTMIDIFTLAVILIMTFTCISSKRARVKQDGADIAYHTIQMRVMFYALIVLTLIMFLALPLLAYAFGL